MLWGFFYFIKKIRLVGKLGGKFIMKKLIKKKTTSTKFDSLKRIYLIGSEFLNTKFTKDSIFSYDIDFDSRKVTISTNKADKQGKGKVCSKEINGTTIPLIDISNQKIAKVFEGINKCNVAIYEDEIVITPYTCEEELTNNNAGAVNKVLKFIPGKKKIKYSMPLSKLDIFLKRVSGDNVIPNQISLFDLGIDLNEDIETQTSFEFIENNGYKNIFEKSLKLTSLLSGYKYLELFAGTGIGGMALDKYGAENIGYSEVDKFAIKNYNANFPNRVNFGDIALIDGKTIPKHDILIFGSPCTDISIMKNDGQGLEGNESKLFFDAIRILNYCKPKWFIFENVRNLLKSNNGNDWEIVKEEFSKNYNIKSQVLDTSHYGIPHTRRRVYVVGQLKSMGEFNFEFPKPIKLELRVQDLLQNIVDEKYYLTEKMSKTVLSFGTGGWYANPETDLEIARPLTSTMAKMHRASQDNYYHTKVAPLGKTNLRRLTPRECARLQGLSDEYKIVVSDTQAYRLIGNAMSLNVVSEIIRKLGLYIKKAFGFKEPNVSISI